MFQQIRKEDILRAVQRAGGAEHLAASEILATAQSWLVAQYGAGVLAVAEAKSVAGNVLKIRSSSPPLSRELRTNEAQLLAALRKAHRNCPIDRILIQ